MNKKELVLALNTLKIKGIEFDENTEVNNPVLAAILKLANDNAELKQAKTDLGESKKTLEQTIKYNDEIIEDLNESNTDLTEQVEKYKNANSKAVLPTVTYKKSRHVFTVPKFQLPKSEATTAEAAADRKDPKELAECVKRGVLVEVKEVKNV